MNIKEDYNKTEARKLSRKRWQETHREYYNNYQINYQRTHKDKIKKYQKKYDLKHQYEKRLHRRVAFYIKVGKLKKQPCIICGSLDRIKFRIVDFDEIESSKTFHNLQWLCHKHFWETRNK